nr:E455 [uncultured bacterium]
MHDVCSPPLRTRPHCLRTKVSRHQREGINQRFLRRQP